MIALQRPSSSSNLCHPRLVSVDGHASAGQSVGSVIGHACAPGIHLPSTALSRSAVGVRLRRIAETTGLAAVQVAHAACPACLSRASPAALASCLLPCCCEGWRWILDSACTSKQSSGRLEEGGCGCDPHLVRGVNARLTGEHTRRLHERAQRRRPTCFAYSALRGAACG